jgi:hypothetical protein
MNETFLAFLYGILILAAALIPTLISVIELIGRFAGS